MTSCLIAVDVQQGFMNQHTELLPFAIRNFLESHQIDHKIFTRFINPGNGHNWVDILDWHGMKEEPDILLSPEIDSHPTHVIDKHTYCPFIDTNLETILRSNGVTTVLIGGVNTDVCVLATAVGLHDRGFRPVVISDLVQSTAGPNYHNAGLMVIPHHIGKHNLVHSEELDSVLRNI